MLHRRAVPSIQDKLRSETAQKAKLREEEVVAVVLYTGPMYVVYNAILTRYLGTLFDDGHCIWTTLNGETGLSKNLFSTTLSVLVSAVRGGLALTTETF